MEIELPNEWKKTIIVPLHKYKGIKDKCNNYREISLFSVPGKVYERVLTKRLMEVIEGKERGFRKGKTSVDQIF